MGAIGAIGIGIAGCGRDETLTVTGPPPTVCVTDLAPPTARFFAIGQPVSEAWVTWDATALTDRFPGSTAYWIDAVSKLEPATTATLVATFRPVEEGEKPTGSEPSDTEFPAGPLLTGIDLDRGFTTREWNSYAYLDRQRDTLVIMAAGG
jgi:hypothetical protein